MKNTTLALIAGALLTGCAYESAGDPRVDSVGEPSGRSSTGGVTSRPTSRPTNRPVGRPTSRPTSEKTVKRLDEANYDHFGDGIAEGGEEVSLASLAANSAKYDGKMVRLRGVVTSVCKKKGCWMNISDGNNEVFVKFVDYAFFMPLQCETREAILEGEFSFVETPVAELKHYLEDEGKHDEVAKVTQPKLQMKVMAAGVALRKRKK